MKLVISTRTGRGAWRHVAARQAEGSSCGFRRSAGYLPRRRGDVSIGCPGAGCFAQPPLSGPVRLHPDRFTAASSRYADCEGRTRAGQGIEWRRNRLPAITVRGTIPDGAEGSEVGLKLFERMKDLRDSLPLAMRSRFRGGAEESAESQASIAAKVADHAAGHSGSPDGAIAAFRQGTVVLSTGPLGIIGAAAALLITGAPFASLPFSGVIALLGIIIRNSIILIDQIDQDIDAGGLRRMRSSVRPCGVSGRSRSRR